MAQTAPTPNNQSNIHLAKALEGQRGADVLRHFCGFPVVGAPPTLNQAAIVCLDMEWWYKEPKPMTELGIAELMNKGYAPDTHAENILTGIQVAHARLIPHAHLRNNFTNAGDPEKFQFGTSKFVTDEEAKQVLINTFVRPHPTNGTFQPIILVGHAVENEFEQIQRGFGVDLRSYGTVVKIIDTQLMAKEARIRAPKGANISLHDLLSYFNIKIKNLHTAGNDAAGTLIAAILIALRDGLYPITNRGLPPTMHGRHIQDVINRVMAIGMECEPPTWGIERFCSRCDRDNHFRAGCFARVNCMLCTDSGVIVLFKNRKTHATSKCLYQYLELPPKDYVEQKAQPQPQYEDDDYDQNYRPEYSPRPEDYNKDGDYRDYYFNG